MFIKTVVGRGGRGDVRWNRHGREQGVAQSLWREDEEDRSISWALTRHEALLDACQVLSHLLFQSSCTVAVSLCSSFSWACFTVSFV